jgi:hypothetical protein
LDILEKMRLLANSDDEDELTMKTVRRWAGQAVTEIEKLRDGKFTTAPIQKAEESPTEPQEQEHRFAVGIEYTQNSFSMVAGVFLDVEAALEYRGDDYRSTVLRLSPVDGDQVLYRWLDEAWKPCNESRVRCA